MASESSKIGHSIQNINRQLKSGHARGANGRELSNEEIEALTQQKDRYQKMLLSQAQQRRIHRINKHTTSEADRVIESVKETVTDATKNSESFFEDISGAGSSTDLKARSKMLAFRANEAQKAERAAIREAAKAEANKQKEEQRNAAAEEKAIEKANAKALKDAAKAEKDAAKEAVNRTLKCETQPIKKKKQDSSATGSGILGVTPDSSDTSDPSDTTDTTCPFSAVTEETVMSEDAVMPEVGGPEPVPMDTWCMQTCGH